MSIPRLIAALLASATLATAAPVALQNADYVVVVHEALRGSWEAELIALKEAQGLQVAVLPIQDKIYGNDRTTDWSQMRIRETLRQAWLAGGKRLRYVLLAGDANGLAQQWILGRYGLATAQKNFASAQMANFIPGPNYHINHGMTVTVDGVPHQGMNDHETILAEDGSVIVSDEYYGNFDGDLTIPRDWPDGSRLVAEAAVGRVPARSVSDMTVYVRKLREYASHLATSTGAVQSVQSRMVRSVNNVKQWGFPEYAELYYAKAIDPNMPSGVAKLDFRATAPDIAGFRAAMSAASVFQYHYGEEGHPNSFFPFFHHGESVELLTDAPTGHQPIVFMPLCDRANFDAASQIDALKIEAILAGTSSYSDGLFTHDEVAITERMLFHPTKGVIAWIGSRASSYGPENRIAGEAFTKGAYSGEFILGHLTESVRQEILTKEASSFGSRVLSPERTLGGLELLGDPAMVINTVVSGSPASNPTGLSATSVRGNVRFSWNPVAGADGYVVEYLGENGWVVGRTTTRQPFLETNRFDADRSFRHASPISWSVRAYRNASVGTGAIPAFPRLAGSISTVVPDLSVASVRNLSVAPIAGGVQLQWSNPSDPDVAAINIYQIDPQGGRVLVASYSPGTLMASVFSGDLLTKYSYLVETVDASGNRSASNVNNTTYALSRHAAIRVWAREASSHEANISKPEIYIENLAEPGLADITAQFWFQQGLTGTNSAVYEDYSTPASTPALRVADADASLGHLDLRFAGALPIGSSTGQGSSGPERVGLHYPDWRLYNKSGDFSAQNLSSTFQVTDRIPVMLNTASGPVQIYGRSVDEIPKALPQDISLQVLCRDDGSVTQVLPICKVRNLGRTVRAFHVRYYVKTAQVPVLAVYSAGDATFSGPILEAPSLYYVDAYFASPLSQGQETKEFRFGLHNADWSTWTKSDDFSAQGMGSTVAATNRMPVLDADSYLMHGSMPFPDPTPPTTTCGVEYDGSVLPNWTTNDWPVAPASLSWGQGFNDPEYVIQGQKSFADDWGSVLSVPTGAYTKFSLKLKRMSGSPSVIRVHLVDVAGVASQPREIALTGSLQDIALTSQQFTVPAGFQSSQIAGIGVTLPNMAAWSWTTLLIDDLKATCN